MRSRVEPYPHLAATAQNLAAPKELADALPWSFAAPIFFYRKDNLDAAGLKVPTNREEYRAAAQKLATKAADGSQVRLKDVARIELGTMLYNAIGRHDSQPAAVIAIYQVPGSNALDVATRIKSTLDDLSKRFPRAMEYLVSLDTTLPVSEGINEIVHTLFEAVALVIIVVFIFLQNWRATLIPLMTVPVSLVGAFIFFPMLGFSINTLSLLGLGRSRVTRVPADAQGRLRPEALPALDNRTLVCVQAGNVNSGAFDPVGEICARAQEAGFWVHVDGAFGYWAAVSPKYAPLLAGAGAGMNANGCRSPGVVGRFYLILRDFSLPARFSSAT